MRTNLVSEVLSLPSVDHTLRLEVVEIVKVERVVLGSELGGSRLSSLDDLVDVVVDEKASEETRREGVSDLFIILRGSYKRRRGTHLFPEAMIFSAPCWIMSRRSSLF